MLVVPEPKYHTMKACRKSGGKAPYVLVLSTTMCVGFEQWICWSSFKVLAMRKVSGTRSAIPIGHVI
jgi:hypothetical protein